MHCVHCNSSAIHSRGISSSGKKRYQCQDCNKWFSKSYNEIHTDDSIKCVDVEYVKFVITSAQSYTPVCELFYAALKQYILANKAKLIVIPIEYKNANTVIDDSVEPYDQRLSEYHVTDNIKLHERLKLLASLKIPACAEQPLSGLDSMTKGDSVIIAHSQVALKTLAVQQEDMPVILTTTGSLSERNYSDKKLGYKANFNHSISAVVVELDGDKFHIRHLNFDGVGFYDFETYYTADKLSATGRIEAIITGDEHVTFSDPKVREATYSNKDSIVNALKPKHIIRHDLLDCYSISHHHKHNVFTNYAKFVSSKNSIEAELNSAIKYVIDTTPPNTKNIIVASNHNDHLLKWLNECDIKTEPWNAITYHGLMHSMLKKTSMKASHAEYPNPFELYSSEAFKESCVDIEFLSRADSYKICGIELASHGDKGQNGSRGSRRQFANLPSKTVIGHSHSPGITHGCYQIGTSSYLQLEYNQGGPSSWLQTHCLIYPNGKRQLVNIIDGKWRS